MSRLFGFICWNIVFIKLTQCLGDIFWIITISSSLWRTINLSGLCSLLLDPFRLNSYLRLGVIHGLTLGVIRREMPRNKNWLGHILGIISISNDRVEVIRIQIIGLPFWVLIGIITPRWTLLRNKTICIRYGIWTHICWLVLIIVNSISIGSEIPHCVWISGLSVTGANNDIAVLHHFLWHVSKAPVIPLFSPHYSWYIIPNRWLLCNISNGRPFCISHLISSQSGLDKPKKWNSFI